MKTIVLTLFALLPLLGAHAQESEYQKKLQTLWLQFVKLDSERVDYRKPDPRLPLEDEQEWLRLRGQLLRDDPIRTLCDQLGMDIEALAKLPSPANADKELLEDLKDLLAHISGYQDRPANLAEATACATSLRQFVVRRDVNGMSRWLKAKFP